MDKRLAVRQAAHSIDNRRLVDGAVYNPLRTHRDKPRGLVLGFGQHQHRRGLAHGESLNFRECRRKLVDIRDARTRKCSSALASLEGLRLSHDAKIIFSRQHLGYASAKDRLIVRNDNVDHSDNPGGFLFFPRHYRVQLAKIAFCLTRTP